MIKKRNEASDGALEINIALPERVIGVDEQGLSAILPVHTSNHSASGDRGEFDKLESFNPKSRALDILILLMSISGSAEQKKTRKMTGSAAKGPASAGLKVAPDLDKRLAKFRRVRMPFNRTGLTAREQKLVGKLVEACGYLESIFWQQSDPEALALYHSLASATSPRDVKLRTYLRINASRLDLIDENKPFVGTDPMPPGRGFYPPGLTREQVEQYVKEHPEEKAAIYDQFTVVRWKEGKLEAVSLSHFLSSVSGAGGESAARGREAK